MWQCCFVRFLKPFLVFPICGHLKSNPFFRCFVFTILFETGIQLWGGSNIIYILPRNQIVFLNRHCTTNKTISPERFWAKYSYPCEYALHYQYRNMKVLWHLWWYSKHSGALSSNSHDLKRRSNSSEDESWPFSFFYVSFKEYILVELSSDKDFFLQMPPYLEFDEKLLTISDTTFRHVWVQTIAIPLYSKCHILQDRVNFCAFWSFQNLYCL